MKIANWWNKKEGLVVECGLCPRNCIINNNQKGFCKTRQNIDGVLYTLVYGYPVAINIDPIEKKPLFHFLPGTNIFSIGTIGCNLECKFCQNYEIARNNYERKGREYLSPEEVVELAINHECKSIAFTYNEPTVFAEYVLDIAKIAKDKNLYTVMVTNGYVNKEPLKDIYTYIDAANIDLKAFSTDFYKNVCNGKHDAVLTAIKNIFDMGVFIELTNLVIPGLNDTEDMIEDLLEWIIKNLNCDIPLHFSAFHPDYKMKDIHRTPKSTLDKIRTLAINKGFKYVYEGNVMTTNFDNTYCPRCNKLLIERQNFTVIENKLKESYCSCGERINIKIKSSLTY